MPQIIALLCMALMCAQALAKSTTETRALLAALQPDDMITYGPENAKREIYIFTDLDCVYCRKQHQEVPALTASGVKVHYLAYPRTGMRSDSGRKITAVFCAKDRQLALTEAKLGIDVGSPDCDNPVRKTLALGDAMQLAGTPSIFIDSGEEIGGYVKAPQILRRLQLPHIEPTPAFALLPNVPVQTLPKQNYLALQAGDVYRRPDTRMPAASKFSEKSIQQFSLGASLDNRRWLGYRKGQSTFYALADQWLPLPEVETLPLRSRRSLALENTQFYPTPDSTSPAMGSIQKDSVVKLTFAAQVEGQRWLGVKNRGIPLYVPASAMLEIPEIETTAIAAQKFVATRATGLYLAPAVTAHKLQDLPAQSYMRYTLEVIVGGQRWLGFSRQGVKYFALAADLQAL